jgi:hypothetical protein
MTYQPEECAFGPPWTARIPSLLYLFSAAAVGILVLVGENSGSNTVLFDYVVAQDPDRVMSIRTLSLVLLIGAISSVARASMRGVRVYPDGVEAREVHNFVVPRVRRYKWPQMERIVLDMKSGVALDLWDGSRAFLPDVSNRTKLESTLERVAAARAIPVRGGAGLDEVVEPEHPDSNPEARDSLP